jgi:hypothetical protein
LRLWLALLHRAYFLGHLSILQLGQAARI